jgi:alpha-beta hydrolase superfamily lysophospholipase
MPGARPPRPRRTSLRAGGALGALVIVLVAVAVALATSGSHPRKHRAGTTSRPVATAALAPATPPAQPRPSTGASTARAPAPPPRPAAKTTIRVATIRITDPRRTMSTPQGTVRRSFTTVIRIPSGPRPPFALIVFGHGFAVSPTPYAPLLDAWARAGYIVASPVFPLENAGAPGGPDENDLPNQPQDMSLVIDRMLSGPMGRLVRRARIAVAGQSDGGDTALAAAYDPRVRDARIRAAVILSGAEDPFISRFTIPAGHVPLLATQGTADTVNPPWMTHQFYDPAGPPKFLLTLTGAGHLPPYTEPGTTLNTVARATTAFLNCYLLGNCARWAHLRAKGTTGTPSVLTGRG